MKFLKYRPPLSFANHSWKYAIIPACDDDENMKIIVEDMVEELENEYYIDNLKYSIINYPPKKWVKDYIKTLENKIDHTNNIISKLKNI